MDRYGYSRPPTYSRVSTAAPSFLNPAVSMPGFPGAGFAGEENILNPNLRPGMPGWAGNAAPPTTPPAFPKPSMPSGSPARAPGGQSSLGQDIAARVQGAVGGNRSGFGGIATPNRPTPPAMPNAFDLGDSIRSRVQAGGGGITPFPTQGQTGRARPPAMPSLPGSDLGAQIRSRVSGGQQGQWGAPPQPPAMPDFRTPTRSSMPDQGSAPAPVAAGQPGIGAPGLTGQSMAPDQGYTPAPTEPTAPSSGGTLGAPQGQVPIGNITGGGDWANVNAYDATFEQAGAVHGVDPAMLKSMMIIESGGAQGAVGAGGAAGAMQIKADVWGDDAAALGYDLNTVEGQIGMAAAILGGDTWNAGGSTPEEIFLSTYYPVPGGLDAYGESGHTPRMYLDDIAMYTDQINGAAPGGGMTAAPEMGTEGITQTPEGAYTDGATTQIPPGTVSGPVTPEMTGTTDETGNALVDAAVSFEGEVPYPSTWTGNPGAGQDPMTYGGWDCSGFTYWLDQNYGDGTLAQGSHHQYQQAMDGGHLNGDPSQLQPGDMVFFDTGLTTGSGAELNNASHVGVYIGDGQFIHSANPSEGTVISSLDLYMTNYPYLGSSDLMVNPGY
ncbi:MAG: NlpC/P60 family protein [Chloroflexota bacterium]|nr:NlpC/P60 family protein [Chloroflexota bacterium]